MSAVGEVDSREVVVAGRYCGPPQSGNGGYVSGLMAEALGGSNVAATLKAPPPLDTPLTLKTEGGTAVLLHGDTEVGRAERKEVTLQAPPPPNLADAEDAAKRYPGLEGFTFDTCFVCGPAREPGDGLRIFAGGVAGEENLYAAPWTPDPTLAENGAIPARYVWSALDCPGYFALGERGLPALLGRLSARVDRTPRPGERCMVTAWRRGEERRKRFAGSALYGEDGTLLAIADAIWIALDRPAPAT